MQIAGRLAKKQRGGFQFYHEFKTNGSGIVFADSLLEVKWHQMLRP
jgi:hypothetical protein